MSCWGRIVSVSRRIVKVCVSAVPSGAYRIVSDTFGRGVSLVLVSARICVVCLYRLVSCVRITVVGYGVIRCDTERGECSDILIVPGMWVDFLKVPGRCDTCVIRTDTGVSHVSSVS